jgi:hypothetical protein
MAFYQVDVMLKEVASLSMSIKNRWARRVILNGSGVIKE